MHLDWFRGSWKAAKVVWQAANRIGGLEHFLRNVRRNRKKLSSRPINALILFLITASMWSLAPMAFHLRTSTVISRASGPWGAQGFVDYFTHQYLCKVRVTAEQAHVAELDEVWSASWISAYVSRLTSPLKSFQTINARAMDIWASPRRVSSSSKDKSSHCDGCGASQHTAEQAKRDLLSGGSLQTHLSVVTRILQVLKEWQRPSV